jgi:predicted amidohydrolase YtcJ
VGNVIGKIRLTQQEIKERKKLRRQTYYKKYVKKVHGEVYYAIKYGGKYALSAQAFTNLPSRMSRGEALEYYSKKLNKVWRKIYG